MIDKKNKKIINGYGTIIVGTLGNMSTMVVVSHISDAKEIGLELASYTKHDIIEEVIFKFDAIEEISNVIQILKHVTEENHTIELNGWVISFERYNKQSVQSWINAFHRLTIAHTLTLAC